MPKKLRNTLYQAQKSSTIENPFRVRSNNQKVPKNLCSGDGHTISSKKLENPSKASSDKGKETKKDLFRGRWAKKFRFKLYTNRDQPQIERRKNRGCRSPHAPHKASFLNSTRDDAKKPCHGSFKETSAHPNKSGRTTQSTELAGVPYAHEPLAKSPSLRGTSCVPAPSRASGAKTKRTAP